MLYFIPAWYADGQWREREQHWYERRLHTEVDDTVKYIQLFQRNAICPYRIMLLSAAPNFRHFLHRQGVLHAPYWSCFDAIQGVRRKKAVPLSFLSLAWPRDVEFFNTMFAALAYRGGQRYAKIEFGEEGNPIQVDLYQDGVLVRTNSYDDRGFVSSTTLYQEGRPHHRDYLGEDGVWRARLFFRDGHVRINPSRPAFLLEWEGSWEEVPFGSTSYAGMDQLIQEVVQAYVARTAPEDIFCAALHPLHMPLLRQVLEGRHLVVSVYEARNDPCLTPQQAEALGAADHLICDSAQARDLLLAHGQGMLKECTVIPPFDARAGLGISQQIPDQNILVPVDGLDPQVLARVTVLLARYLDTNPRARVCLFTRRPDWGLPDTLLQTARQTLEQAGIPWQPAGSQEEEEDFFPLPGEDQEEVPAAMSARWSAQQCVDELTMTQCLRRQRLVVDLRPVRDVYLRVAAISLALPQILMRPSEYVEPGRNGVVLDQPDQLPRWLDHYLGSLANWNGAMVAAYQVGKRYNVTAQIQRWKEVLSTFGSDPSSDSGD